jgi:predicted HNH restriction endonuclease
LPFLITDHDSLFTEKSQICGFGFREKYGVDFAEAHHIIPFTQSMNNNPENILILCPNHHRVIHKAGAVYDLQKTVFF